MSETVNQEPVTTAAGEQQEPRTFTQAEVNSIVADRLTRERAKYADYDDLKTKAQQFDTTKAELDALNAANAPRGSCYRRPCGAVDRRHRGSLHRSGTGRFEVRKAGEQLSRC